MWTKATWTRREAASPRMARRRSKFTDFRKLLERDDIHVIINGTPDHWHTLVNLAAAKAKKDIYSRKAADADH